MEEENGKETFIKGSSEIGQNMEKVHTLLKKEEKEQKSSEGIGLGTLLITTWTEKSLASGAMERNSE